MTTLEKALTPGLKLANHSAAEDTVDKKHPDGKRQIGVFVSSKTVDINDRWGLKIQSKTT